MKVTLKQMLVFKTIHVEGQVSKAAKSLFMSVPAVSMALKDLESALNSRLFERTASGLKLTPQGQLLLPYVNRMLSTEAELQQLFSAAAIGTCGTLTIGACKTAGNYVLSRSLPEFHRRFPATQVKLVIKDANRIAKMIAERELDLAFVDSRPSIANLRCELWLRDKLTIVCGATHPLANQVVTSAQLSEEVWYFDESQTITRTRAIQLLSSVNVLPSQEITMGTLGAIKRATATGYGVSILPYIAIDAELARGDLVELQLSGWDFERNYWVIQRADEPVPTLAINFMQYWAENKLRLHPALAI